MTVKTTAGPVGLARPKLRGTTEAFASRLFGAHVTKTNALESLVPEGGGPDFGPAPEAGPGTGQGPAGGPEYQRFRNLVGQVTEVNGASCDARPVTPGSAGDEGSSGTGGGKEGAPEADEKSAEVTRLAAAAARSLGCGDAGLEAAEKALRRRQGRLQEHRRPASQPSRHAPDHDGAIIALRRAEASSQREASCKAAHTQTRTA